MNNDARISPSSGARGSRDDSTESTDPSSQAGSDSAQTVSVTSGADADDVEKPLAVAASVILIAHPDDQLLGYRYDLKPGSVLIIGRSPDADVSLPEIRSISRMHARVEHRGSTVVIEDLGSTNGTIVNDERIKAGTSLASGDRFQVGSCHFKLLHDQDVEIAYHQTIYNLVVQDGLTDAFTKRKFNEEFAREFSRAGRYDRPLSLVLFDLDHFKAVNDSHGHLCGDSVLQGVAARVRRQVRAEQIFARVGGEEFAILCPETEANLARIFAERLRLDIDGVPFCWSEIEVKVTCSFGVAELSGEMSDADELFKAADRALYIAKNSGRNTVSVYTSEG